MSFSPNWWAGIFYLGAATTTGTWWDNGFLTEDGAIRLDRDDPACRCAVATVLAADADALDQVPGLPPRLRSLLARRR